MQLVRLTDALPDDFERLRTEAEAEGYGMLDRLEDEFDADPGQFEALLAAFIDGELVGIGALTAEPAAPPGEAYRMRRFYVSPEARRRGVGSALAGALLTEALTLTRLVTLNCPHVVNALFWEALGYERVEGKSWTHQMRYA